MAISSSGTSAKQYAYSTTAAFDPPSGLTFTGWYKSNASTGSRAHFASIFGNGYSRIPYCCVYKDGGGAGQYRLSFLDYNGVGDVLGGTTGHNDGIWVYWAMRMNASWVCQVASRRVTESTFTYGTASSASSAPTNITQIQIFGNSYNGTGDENMQGALDNLIIYNGALTNDEIEQQFFQRIPIRPDLVRVWHPCISRGGDADATLKDLGPGNYAYTRDGTLSVVDGAPVAWGPSILLFSKTANTYNNAVSETLSLTDAEAQRALKRAAASESQTLTDAEAQRALLRSAVDETQTLTDLAAGDIVIQLGNVDETITPTDTPAQRVIRRAAVSETLSLTDSDAVAWAKFLAAVTETITLTDTPDSGALVDAPLHAAPINRLRLAARIGGRTVVGSYDEVMRMLESVADDTVDDGDVEEATSSKLRRAVARRKASEFRDTVQLISLDTDIDGLSRRSAMEVVFRELRRDYNAMLQRVLAEKAQFRRVLEQHAQMLAQQRMEAQRAWEEELARDDAEAMKIAEQAFRDELW